MTQKCEVDEFHHLNPSFPTQLVEFLQTKFIFLFYMIYLIYLPAKVYQKAKKPTQNLEIDGNFPKRQEGTPEGKDSHLVCIWGTSTYATGVTNLGTL